MKEALEAEREELREKLADAKKIEDHYDPSYGMDMYYQMEILGVERALDHLDSLSTAHIELMSKGPQREPLVLFEFCIGEHPRLPAFGRHFNMCDSKVLGNSSDVIHAIYNIIHRHFPDHVVLWRDYDDDSHKKYFRRDPGEAEGRAEFYRKLEEQFDNFKHAGTAQEFRIARKTFAGI